MLRMGQHAVENSLKERLALALLRKRFHPHADPAAQSSKNNESSGSIAKANQVSASY